MKENRFPTIKEMLDSISSELQGYCEVHYDESTHTFVGVEYIQRPVYYGGSVDSIEVLEEPLELTFEQAYQIWLSCEEFEESIKDKIQAIYLNTDWEDFELPF